MLDPGYCGPPTASASISNDALRKANPRNEKRIYLESARYAQANRPAPEDPESSFYPARVSRLSRSISDG